MQMCTPEILYKLAFILKNYIWLVSYNDTSLSYWTSDNPITFKKYKNKFFKSPFKYWPDAHEVAYPLNPKYLLVMLERTNFRQWEAFDCRKIDSKYDNVIHYNSRYVDYFCRLIISRDNNFELANKWCEENPEAASRFETFSSKAST